MVTAVSVAVTVGVEVSAPAQMVGGLDRFCGLLGMVKLRSARLLSVS